MTAIDWGFIVFIIIFLVVVANYTKRYTRSVADFVAANRCAGRYLLCIAHGMAAVGAVSIVTQMQITYHVGFSLQFWYTLGAPLMLIMTLTGWIAYRFRQTRALTLAQFFELRYSKKFRVYSGIMCFFAGIINYGVFPGIGAKFFIYYYSFPDSFLLFGIDISTYALVMFLLLSMSLYLTLMGGQIAVIVTDFLQGFFVNIVMVLILIFLVIKFKFSDVFDSMLIAEPGKSMVNPLDIGANKGFNIWFFLIGLFTVIYSRMAWQAESGYNSAAKSAHESKMAGVIGEYRYWFLAIIFMFLPLCAYTIMHHPKYVQQAAIATEKLSHISNEHIRDLMTTPVVMTTFLPRGLMGAFAAVVLVAFISTHNTQLHSWGSIFIQDVIVPLRKKPLKPEQHLKYLRFSAAGVACIAFFFSMIFRQTQYIQLFFMITGAIYISGAGSAIIGGLYWKRGTTAAAWTAMIVGSICAVISIIADQCWTSLYKADFPIDFKWLSLMCMGASIFSYILVSLLGKREVFNMDRMLHRGSHNLDRDGKQLDNPCLSFIDRAKQVVGFTNEFTRGDKIIYGISIGKTFILFILFLIMLFLSLFVGLSDKDWVKYQFGFFMFYLVPSLAIAVWLSIGGIRDLISLFKTLKTAQRNYLDDGTVVNHHNVGEKLLGEPNEDSGSVTTADDAGMSGIKSDL